MEKAYFSIACLLLLISYCEHIYREEYRHYSMHTCRTISKGSIPGFIIFFLPFKNRQYRNSFSRFFYLFQLFHYALFSLLIALSFIERMESLCWLLYFFDLTISCLLLAFVEKRKK